jgi:predicted nucleic acid-binding protein
MHNEVLSALRRQAASGDLGPSAAAQALHGLELSRVRRHPPRLLLGRVWSLRRTVTIHDSSYVALAEALDAPLVTADARLARSHGHAAAIELVPA